MTVFIIAKKYLTTIDFNNTYFIKENNNNNNIKQCMARIWDKGEYGNTQCSNHILKNCLCSKHYNASLRMGGEWWLGMINTERPEELYHPISGKHHWSKDIYGNDYEKEEKVKIADKETEEEVKVKRPRGRPKGSKNKKKVT